jgi:hypothetical protein
MKTLIITLFLTFSLNGLAANLIDIKIFGRHMSPDSRDMEKLNGLLGGYVTHAHLKRFQIIAYGIEGGYHACVEPAPSLKVEKILKALKGLKMNLDKTSYSVQMVEACP